MSDFADARSTWTSLCRELQPDPEGQDPIISNEPAFHTAFDDLCAEVHERDPQRLLARFLREHAQIIAFIGALDDSLELEEEDCCLGSCFWTIAYSTVYWALRRKKKRTLFERYMKPLNEELPAFGSRLSEFPNDSRVQEPLQKAFELYIRCYLVMRAQFTSRSAPITLEDFAEQAKGVTVFFTETKTEWAELVEAAKQEQAQRLAASQPSFPNGTLGPLTPYNTRVTFEWLETLGHGTYGQVSKVRESSTGTIYAQKTIRVTDPRLAAVFERQVQNEVQIMQELRHHHIASVQFYVRDPDAFSMIMLPVADYDLQTFLQHICINAGFPTTELTRLTSWFGCLVSALAFVHANKIKHEDIKPRNILIKDSQPYLADFGCAQDFSEWESSVSPDNLVHGTPVYWAPEDPPRRRAADVFSLGCVFSEMLTVRQNKTLEDYRTYRRRNSNNPNAFSGNLDRVYEWLEQLKAPHDRTGDSLIEQIRLMLDRDPRRRAEAKHVKRALPDAVFCYTCW